jgi:hypothetical protein
MRIQHNQATKSHPVKYLRRAGAAIHSLELDMSGQSKPKRSKNRRKNDLKANVVMTLFCQETLAIRNLTKRSQELDRKLKREFISFNRISDSIERKNDQIRDLLLEPIVRTKRLEKVRSQQRFDLAWSFGTQEEIGRLLQARSDAISDLVRRQHELAKVR